MQHSQEVKLDKSYLEASVTELLNQISECAIFICQYFQHTFGGTVHLCCSPCLLDTNVNITGRLAHRVITDSLAKIEKFRGTLAQLRERLSCHMQIAELVVTSRIQDDVSGLGKFVIIMITINSNPNETPKFNRIH